jgi:trk system potassium uptake protein TrkA
MNIIIAGIGKIGFAVADTLVKEGHDVTVIDKSTEIITDVTNIYDVIGVCGNCADCEVLEEAGVDKADLFIAFTDSDEMNMLSCYIARKMGAKHTVARIRNPEYNDRSLGFMRQQLNLSMSVNPELLVAQELYNILKLPSAFKVEYFARRSLEIIEIKLKSDSPLCGKKLSKLREKQNVQFLIGAVLRDDKVVIPDGNFELSAGDIISIAATPVDMQKLLKGLGIITKKARSVMILGGSKTAYYLAKMLLSSGNEVKIIEKNTSRCEELSDIIPKAVLINGDGSQPELLREEGLMSLDAFVALTGMDEENILMSIYAGNQNVPKVISKVNRVEMIKMAEKLGLDCVVSSKSITSDIILRYTRAIENSIDSDSIETLYKMMDGKVEAIEFKLGDNSELFGVPIKEMKIKSGVLIAAIIRANKKAVIPSGDDVIKQGDRVIVLSATSHITQLSDILR